MKRSILSQVRDDAYAEGFGQGAMVGHDTAYDDGRRDAFAQASREKCRWGWFCFGCGIGVTALVVTFI